MRGARGVGAVHRDHVARGLGGAALTIGGHTQTFTGTAGIPTGASHETESARTPRRQHVYPDLVRGHEPDAHGDVGLRTHALSAPSVRLSVRWQAQYHAH